MSEKKNTKPAEDAKADPSKKKDPKKDAKDKEEELVTLTLIDLFSLKRTKHSKKNLTS